MKSRIKSVLAGIGLVVVGYGAYRGAKYLMERNASSGRDLDAAIKRARARAEAELADTELGGDFSVVPNIGNAQRSPVSAE